MTQRGCQVAREVIGPRHRNVGTCRPETEMPALIFDGGGVNNAILDAADAIGGKTFSAALGSADLGNNINWRFPPRGTRIMLR